MKKIFAYALVAMTLMSVAPSASFALTGHVYRTDCYGYTEVWRVGPNGELVLVAVRK